MPKRVARKKAKLVKGELAKETAVERSAVCID
jgi:hypothetical protein